MELNWGTNIAEGIETSDCNERVGVGFSDGEGDGEWCRTSTTACGPGRARLWSSCRTTHCRCPLWRSRHPHSRPSTENKAPHGGGCQVSTALGKRGSGTDVGRRIVDVHHGAHCAVTVALRMSAVVQLLADEL